MSIKAVLLDLDDTLITSSQVYRKALRYCSDFLANLYNLDKDEFFNISVQKHLLIQDNFPTVHTRHSRILVFRFALEEANVKYDLAILPEVEDMYWNYFLDTVQVFPEVFDTLSELKKMGLYLAVISDGSLALRIRKLEKTHILPFLDQVVASEEVIFEKPFSAIFTLALSRLQVEPEQAIMLGNDYKSDIRGAQMVGIKAGLFNPPKLGAVVGDPSDTTPDFEISRFSELLEVVKKW